jgi:hypothetical protein
MECCDLALDMGHVAGACGCGNVPTVSIKFGKFFISLGPVSFFRKESAARKFRNLTAFRIIRTQTILVHYLALLTKSDLSLFPVYGSECLAAVNVHYLFETTTTTEKKNPG